MRPILPVVLKALRAAGAATVAVVCACGGGSTPTSPGTQPPVDPPNQPPTEETFVGAGDIGWCNGNVLQSAGTAQIIEGISGSVFTTGDNAYPHGTPGDFTKCYDPTWGRFRNRTYPAPGNHDWDTASGGPYFAYFGSRAGPSGIGYYSYDLGAWHIVSLNSNIAIGAGSAQLAWLQADLAANRKLCAAAYWHHPLFSSGSVNGGSHDPGVRDLWRVLYENNVDIVLNGHEHSYERFAPQDPDGHADESRGIVEFVVGTGGGPLYPFGAIQPNSIARDDKEFGVLKLLLHNEDYQFQFIPVGQPVIDSGAARCH